MNKEKYIKTLLKDNIKFAEKEIKKLEEELTDIYKLPNDCKDIMINDVKCENKDYKIDLLTNHYHVIGYMTSLKTISEQILELNKMTNDEFNEHLIEQEKIEIHNQKVMNELNQHLKDNNINI